MPGSGMRAGILMGLGMWALMASLVFALTGWLGFSLGPILSHYIGIRGFEPVLTALGGTALIFGDIGVANPALRGGDVLDVDVEVIDRGVDAAERSAELRKADQCL